MPQADLSRVPPFYHNYIKLVTENELNAALEAHVKDLSPFLQSIPENKWDYRYAPGKWSVKEMVQHLMDAERIFAYRALCIARGDKTSLPGFDENIYAVESKADRRSKKDLLEELEGIQRSTQALFQSFDEVQLERSGTANANSIYVKGIGFIIPGHAKHHVKILEERYL